MDNTDMSAQFNYPLLPRWRSSGTHTATAEECGPIAHSVAAGRWGCLWTRAFTGGMLSFMGRMGVDMCLSTLLSCPSHLFPPRAFAWDFMTATAEGWLSTAITPRAGAVGM